MRRLPHVDSILSLSSGAEILRAHVPPSCDLKFATYASVAGYLLRLLQAPWIIRQLACDIGALRPHVAICAMPGTLDLLMVAALRQHRVPLAVVVHDADVHPGDGLPLQMFLQRQLLRRADMVAAISQHTVDRLREQGDVPADRMFVVSSHPPFAFGPAPAPPGAHGGPMRLLFFGRLLAYKGLDLLARAMHQLDARYAWELRVVGSGPESADLASLRAIRGVTVENRWVPEDEIGDLLAWADAVVLPYREASQSGVAPAAVAAGRCVVATRVGGLTEQLGSSSLARLCEPDPTSLAAALRDVIDAPPALRPTVAPVDPRLAWRDMAEQLLAKVASHAAAYH